MTGGEDFPFDRAIHPPAEIGYKTPASEIIHICKMQFFKSSLIIIISIISIVTGAPFYIFGRDCPICQCSCQDGSVLGRYVACSQMCCDQAYPVSIYFPIY
jgi:hypothetical protein